MALISIFFFFFVRKQKSENSDTYLVATSTHTDCFHLRPVSVYNESALKCRDRPMYTSVHTGRKWGEARW